MNENFELTTASSETREAFRRLAEEARKLKRLSELKALKLNERKVNYDPAELIAMHRAAEPDHRR